MKSILSIIFLIPMMLFSQENGISNDSVVEHPEKAASFPGGAAALHQFIADNIEYPSTAMEIDEQGKVFVEFIVNTDGSISNVKVLRGMSDELNNESMRVVKMMPNWIPAQLGNENVRTVCRVPFNFRLDNESSDSDE